MLIITSCLEAGYLSRCVSHATDTALEADCDNTHVRERARGTTLQQCSMMTLSPIQALYRPAYDMKHL